MLSSQSMNDHLEALGVTEMARMAADKLEVVVKIDFTPGFVTIAHESLLGEKIRRLAVDSETMDLMHNGMESSHLLSLESKAAFKVVVRWPMGVIIDTRTLEDSGLMMKQVLHLTTLTGVVVSTTRIFNRQR